MCPSLIQIGSKTAEKNSAQTNRQTDRHYENNGHLAVNQKLFLQITYAVYVANKAVCARVFLPIHVHSSTVGLHSQQLANVIAGPLHCRAKANAPGLSFLGASV